MTSPATTTPVEHWSTQVDTPFRGPAEIRELAVSSRPGAATGGGPWAEMEDVFGEDLALAEDEFEAYAEQEPTREDEDYDEAELAAADLLEEAQASEHPLAAVFSLPRLAFDAMAKGAWATAIAVAVGTGLRDVNRLTNMVFWFRHPQLTGQKIGPDQRDLAQEWLQIRDQVVKPALSGGSPTPSTAPPMPAPTTAGARTSIPSSGLRWFGPPAEETPELLAFMRKVYDLHVKRSQGDFVDTLPESALDDVESGKKARKDAAAKAREMLIAARARLAAEGLTGTVRIGVLSAYRSADHQFDIWQGKTTKGKGGFPHYYQMTKLTRRLPKYGGEHSDKAAAYLAQYIGNYVAAPGYSNHQDGLSLDLGTRKGKGGLIKVYEGSWFHNWLKTNAGTYHFKPLASEAWHWTFRPSPGGSSEAEMWSSEVTPTTITAGRIEVPRIPLLASHRGNSPDLILRWNDMTAVPAEIDVVVHLHGYSWANMTLPKHIEVWAGLDLSPIDGAAGTGRSRPTLTVLPRGHFTGVKVGRIYRYTFPALTTRDGLTTLISAALKEFADRVGGLPPKVGRLILTAHSGGGAPLMQILRRHDPQEVYVFDGLYQDASALAEWAGRHVKADRAAVQSGAEPTGGMRVFFGPSTRSYSLRLDASLAADLRDAPASVRDRYRVESSSLGHWQIARQYGWRVLADPAVDVPSAARPSKPSRVKRESEVDAAEAPFLPEVPFLPEAPFLPETTGVEEMEGPGTPAEEYLAEEYEDSEELLDAGRLDEEALDLGEEITAELTSVQQLDWLGSPDLEDLQLEDANETPDVARLDIDTFYPAVAREELNLEDLDLAAETEWELEGMHQETPKRSHGRTALLTLDATASALPKAVRDAARVEVDRLFTFTGGRGKRRLTVVWRTPDTFPTGMTFTDAVVSVVEGSSQLAAHVDAALRQQRKNAQHVLAAKGFRVNLDTASRTLATPERVGLAVRDKRVETASNGKRLALPFMSAAVAKEEVLKEVVDEIKTGATVNAVAQRRRGASFRYWASAQALTDQRLLEDVKIVASHPQDPTKWPTRLQGVLGKALGRAIAHEIRHLFVGSGHAETGLGSESPRMIGDPNFTDFSIADQRDILSALQTAQTQQANATLVETFPVAKREAGFPF